MYALPREAQNDVSVAVQVEDLEERGLLKRTEGEQDVDRTLGRPCLTIRLPHGQRATTVGTGPSPPLLASKLRPDEAM